ncbi:FadR/GntR family transcriptional regulator [Sphingomonas sp. Leaf343]|uniref:FadR/GntR family transcriptional regulator n=1 Tax=Sphingomonas sp. Leaf343 TaxID=1736345 RepID=UPI0006FD5179|nr:FadR/GntR family transcriptional regulator [Sphingomonas sp. Leaf343]KQR87382.1 hypothetical protein ASG07_00090 [Sphingomonas sp. Leaf343]
MAQSDKLYRRITDGILQRLGTGEFEIGSRLPTEREIAEHHAVSRTTVREAMVALEMMGVVEMRKGSGIYVAALRLPGQQAETLDIGAFEILEARRSIEAEVAALAAPRIDDKDLARLETLLATMTDPDIAISERADRDFHLVIAEATGNSAMVAVVTDLWAMRDRCDLARTIHERARGGGELLRVEEHRAVLDALRSHNTDAARAEMRRHLDAVIEHLLAKTENEEVAAVRRRSAHLRQRIFADYRAA